MICNVRTTIFLRDLLVNNRFNFYTSPILLLSSSMWLCGCVVHKLTIAIDLNTTFSCVEHKFAGKTIVFIFIKSNKFVYIEKLFFSRFHRVIFSKFFLLRFNGSPKRLTSASNRELELEMHLKMYMVFQ
jgi:hypothetical protein